MSATLFDAFKAELSAIRANLAKVERQTLRDETLLERFRLLFRTWVTSVRPAIEPLLRSRKEFLKLDGQLELLAGLTTRQKRVSEYRHRLNNAIRLANGLVLFLPPSGDRGQPAEPHRVQSHDTLFVSGIPDLPLALVPNAILGWRTQIERFLTDYPFDQSVFIMIRYRDRNKDLIKRVKAALANYGYNGILASDHTVTDDLYNPIACLLCCSRGLAVFDAPESDQTFNPNVAYELGMMHLLGRECRILKHQGLKVLHTDILMKLYLSYSSAQEAEDHVVQWIGNNR